MNFDFVIKQQRTEYHIRYSMAYTNSIQSICFNHVGAVIQSQFQEIIINKHMQPDLDHDMQCFCDSHSK